MGMLTSRRYPRGCAVSDRGLELIYVSSDGQHRSDTHPCLQTGELEMCNGATNQTRTRFH